MLRFGDTEMTKENCYATKRPTNIWDANVDNIVISKLVKTKTNSKNLVGYLNKPLVLIFEWIC